MSLTNKLKKNNEQRKAKEMKLLNGEYGLKKTFWLFWFIPMALFSMLEQFSNTDADVAKIDTGMLFWGGLMFICILRTKSKPLWKTLALIMTGADALLSLTAIIMFLK